MMLGKGSALARRFFYFLFCLVRLRAANVVPCMVRLRAMGPPKEAISATSKTKLGIKLILTITSLLDSRSVKLFVPCQLSAIVLLSKFATRLLLINCSCCGIAKTSCLAFGARTLETCRHVMLFYTQAKRCPNATRRSHRFYKT